MQTRKLTSAALPASLHPLPASPAPAGRETSPPHLLQDLPDDLRKLFLQRFVADALSTRQAAVQLRGWARITRSHRAEVLDLLKQPAYCAISLLATARVIPRSISMYCHPGNRKQHVRQALLDLARDHSQIQLSLGSYLGLLHEFGSHCRQLGRLVSDPRVRYLRLDLTGISYEGCIYDLFEGMRKAGAKPGATLTELELRWLWARPDPPLLGALHYLSSSVLAQRLTRLDLRGMDLEPDHDLLNADLAAPLLFSALQALALSAGHLEAIFLGASRIKSRLRELIQIVDCSASLRRLDLRDCRLNAEHADALLDCVKSRAGFELTLKGNPIPPEHPIWQFDSSARPSSA